MLLQNKKQLKAVHSLYSILSHQKKVHLRYQVAFHRTLSTGPGPGEGLWRLRSTLTQCVNMTLPLKLCCRHCDSQGPDLGRTPGDRPV